MHFPCSVYPHITFSTGMASIFAYANGRFISLKHCCFSRLVIVFLIGLISEQITALTYRRIE